MEPDERHLPDKSPREQALDDVHLRLSDIADELRGLGFYDMEKDIRGMINQLEEAT